MKSPHYLLPVLATGIMSLLALTARAQTNDPGLFSLNVTTLKKKYLAGEPVGVTVKITYNGKEALKVTHPLDHQEYSEDLEVAPTNGTPFVRHVTPEEQHDALKDRTRMPEIRFAPGSDTVRAYWLGCCPRLPGQAQGVSSGELFPDLGDYIIRFTLTLNGTKYTNHTVVRVEEPVREVDKRAYEWLSQQKWMYRQQWLDQQYLLKMLPVLGHARADQSLFQLVTPLQDQYHDSVYAEFVRGLMTTPAATIKPASKVNLEEEASTLENRPRWLDWLLGGALVLLAVILYRARKRQRLP